jgi:predicted transposase/invertase (TIGR01784 family)
VQLKNQQNQVFYDKLTFIYLTLPNFTKTEDELETLQDKWFFLFRHLHRLQEQPQKLQERIFNSLFKQANIAQFKPEERTAYESSLKYYRDLTNVIDTAWGDGEKVGIEKGYQKAQAEIQAAEAEKQAAEQRMVQAVMSLFGMGLSDEQIAQSFQISVEEVTAIKDQQTRH